ncbi:hypothetical protein F4677DRAFT_403472 [Hypoxylon crocopeplum]|nr:hypothetical protein F4677DRAFT_403472 [Hypoxylon crocopeplum]
MNGMWTHPYYDQTGNDGRGSLAPGPDDAERAQLISEHWLRAMNFLDEDPATSTNHSMSRSSDEGTPHVTGSVAASSEEYFEPPMTSEEQAERQHWEALKANMARLGFDRSPFVPRTFAEFREFQKGGKGSKKQTSAAETGHVAVGMNKRLVQASMADGLTLVTGRKSIWSEDCKQNGHVDWPTPEEYKQSGTTLPLPRVQQLDPQFAHLRPQLPRFGPDVPPKYRQVAEWALRPKFDGVTTEEAPDLELPTAEIELEGLDSFTRQLILDIDNEE